MKAKIMEEQEIKELIQKTLENQRYGVYNTVRNEQPHSALVGFATTPDLSKIIILTPKNTRKYINTQLNQKVNLFVSTTTNDPKDLDTALTISVLGTAEVSEKINPEIITEYRRLFLEKNPHMSQLATKIDEMIVITVETFEVTKNYQKSVIQTNAEIDTLQIRQIPVTSVVKGIARGKALKISKLSDISRNHEQSILIISTITESDTIPKFSFKGLVVGDSNIPKSIESILKIPTIKGIGSEIEKIKSGQEISINGSLGLLILHEIKY